MHDWDDIRYFITAARTGSLAAAAEQLGVDAATVGRKIARLESTLKLTLFTRSRSGLQLTGNGGRLLEASLEVETAMQNALEAGSRDVVGGTVRISVAEGFGTSLVAPALPALRRERPSLRIELAAQSSFLSPHKREADIAVTLSAPSRGRIVVEPLTNYELGLYAAPSYFGSRKPPRDLDALRQHDIIAYIDDLLYAPELRYLNELGSDLQPAISSSSIRAQREIIREGGGVGVLPCFMSDGLKRILPTQVSLKRRFWLSTHRDVVETARVRAVRTWLKALVHQKSSILNPTASIA